MQELRSTAILDKEIEADARRKAEAVLKHADEECMEIIASVDKKIELAKKEKEEFYSKKIIAFQNDLNASGPLEKQRFKVSFIQKSITDAVNKYLSSLSQIQRLSLVADKFDFSICKGKKITAYIYGFDLKETEKYLKDKLGDSIVSVVKTEYGKIIIEDEINLEINEGIILEAEDKTLRCRLTLVHRFAQLFDKYRNELAETLFSSENNGGAE